MIDGLHTTLIILQPHVPIVQKASHLRGYPKPNRPSVEHPVPNAELLNKQQKRSKDTRGKNRCSAAHTLNVSPCTQLGVPSSQDT